MWRYYLLACAGTFRARTNRRWQIGLSPRGVEGATAGPRQRENKRVSGPCAALRAVRGRRSRLEFLAKDTALA